MDLFQDENFLAMEALTKRRNEYRTRKSNQYAEVASGIRAALNREGKLQITEEFAKDLGITDKTDRKQLEKAYNTATERAKYWDPSGDRMLTEEDVAAMDAEINAKADTSAKKREELKARRDAIKSGKLLPKKDTPQKETTTPVTSEKSSAVEKPSTKRERTIAMSAEKMKKADAILADIDFDTDLSDSRSKQTILSGRTSRNQNPAGNEYGKKWNIFKPGTRNVDIGAGRFNKATEFLAEIGVKNIPFDPVNRDSETNRKSAEEVRENPADTATVHNVLNVIDNDSVVEGIVNQAARAIKKTGSAIFTIHEGDKSGVGAKTKYGYQRNAKASSYLPTIRKFFGSVEAHGNVILAKQPKDIGSAFWAFDSSFDNGIEWDTDFDYEKFGKLVTGVGKLVDILTEDGYKDFKSLATFISESDVNKYEKAKTVLQDVWNAVARQKGLERVSDTQAKEIYDIIDKEVENGRTNGNDQRLDAGDGGSLGGVSPSNDAQSATKKTARGESVRSIEEGSGTTVQGAGGGSGRNLGDDQGGRDNPSGRGYRGGQPRESGTDSGANRRDDRPAVPVQRGEVQSQQRPASNGVDAGTQRRESGLDAGRSESGADGGTSEKRSDGASPSVKRAAKKAVEKTGPVYTDFVMTPAVEEAILERSPIKRVRNNVAAIKLLQELKERDFKATPSEQEVLAKYVGWGGLSEMFSSNYERAWEMEENGYAENAKDYAKNAKYGVEGYEAYKEIRQTLNDEEYAAAKGTVLTAFYTPIQMVRIEHEALRKLGVVGGRFLGPSAGVGNYASAAGNYAKGANWQFVEKDQISGQILRALFPNQRVHIGGYEETNLADSFFDFAIDNVPYADINITDKKIGKYPYKIHDYFFAKTLSKVRPGGIIMFLTSTGTLDKTDGRLRQFLSQHGGKIVGAVRLPNGFFSKNAGTDVASDLVIIQRVNGEADNTGFMEQQKYGTDTEYVRRQGRVQVDLTYNKYFADNPGQVIGEMKVGSGQYGRAMLEYKMPSGDMFAKVSEAIDNALSGIDRDALMKSAPAIEQKDHTPVYDSEGLRQGNITLKGDKLYEKSGDELVEIEMPKLSAAQKKKFAKKMLSSKKIIEKIIGVRRALRSVVDAEVNGMDDEHLQPLIDNLNEVYDDFVKRVGTFHDKTVTPFVMLDKADGNRLMTMERATKVDGNDVIEKADILKKRVIFTYQRPTKADTLADALTISYSEYGYIRWDRIGELMGIPKDDVGKRLVDEGLAFENPQTGIHEPYWEYLSGHVRRKLEAARAAMQNDPAFAKNVEALEKVQPKDVSLDEVTIKFGNTWVDPAAMIDFLKEVYDIRGYQDVKLTKNETVGKWNLELPRSSVEPFGTTSFTQEHFLQAVLNSESLEVRAKDSVTNKYYVLERETEAQKLAAEKLHEAFARFLRTSEKWYEPSSESFNLAMNDNVAMVLPNNILPFRAAGMSEDVIKKLHAEGREYQPAVIARGVLGGKSLCLAHCVGAGKTLEMQSIGMIGRHLGMFKKSMYVVPNHMLDQFCNEFLAAFPNANILKMSTEDVQPKNRRAFFAKVANGDWDAIVVKHSTFSKKLPMTEKWQKDYLEREVRRLTEAKMAAKGDKASAKDIEKMIVQANEKIKKLDNSDEKDNEIVPFEELGVDQLFVDEAHNFKGLPVVSSQARKVKGLAQRDSQRALDMEMKTQYVQSLHDGKRGVVFATGTPLSNAPVVEAYVNLRYLAPWALEEQGIRSFDDFVNTFGRIETESEFGIDGKSTKEVQRVTAFVNIPEMMRLFKSVVDIVNSDQIKVKRPKMVMEAVPVQMSDAQASIMEMVAAQSAIPPSKEERSKLLTLSGIAKRACISPRLLGVDDDGNKLIACANKVKQVYDETSEVRGAQLIFTDIFNSSDAVGVIKYVGGRDGYTGKKWNLNDHLKELLVRSGIPAEQIGVIHDVDKAKGGDEGKDAAKEALFAKVRSGEIRVLIGSRPRMGEGTNVQERLAAIHLLHPGWKPSEDTQAIGRIIRPGNIFESGKVFYYLTQGNKNIGSYETKNHELIGVKDRLIQAVMHGDETIREIDLDETSAERDMLMGLASANQDLIKLIDVRRILHKAELNVESVAFSARSNADNATRTERALEKAKEDFAEQERGAKEWREKNADSSFVLTVPDGRKLESMKDMSEYISLQVTKQLKKDRYDRDERLEIGNFGGVPLILSCTFADNKIHLSVPSLGYAKEINYSGFLADFSPQAMTAFKGRIMSEVSPEMEKAHKQTIADTENRIKRLKADAARFNEEWQREKEKLTKLRAERARLERAVTPLIVQTTEDHKYSAYGNWAITKNGKTYNAIRQTDRKEVSAPSVKALLPMMDAEDFSLPGQSANKTIDLAPLLENRGNERGKSVTSVAIDEVDFDTEFLNPPDFKRDRRFDVVDNGALHENAIRHFSRKGAEGFIRSGKSRFSKDASVYESGVWQKRQKNDIITRREKQIRAIDRQSPLALRKAGVSVVAAIRAGLFDETARSGSTRFAGAIGAGYERNSESIARVRESDLFGVRGVDVNGWTTYSDGTVVIPLEGDTKASLKNILALNQVFPNTWRFDGFGSYKGKPYIVAHTDKVGTPIKADTTTKHRFLSDNGFNKSQAYNQMLEKGRDIWGKDGIVVDANKFVLGRTSDGETFAYNAPMTIRAYELETGNAGVDFDTQFNISIDDASTDPSAKAYLDALARPDANERTSQLAPNGKRSNLSNALYHLVRTKRFKDWFGDWENDPANASKVVDENGEPLIVWHGAKNKHNVYNQVHTFHISNREVAHEYGDVVDGNFVNAKNIIEIDANGGEWLSVETPKELIGKFNDGEEIDDGRGFTATFDEYSMSVRDIATFAKRAGYDGVIVRNVEDTNDGTGKLGTDIVTFESTQIKSADPVTYDDAGNVIPLSQRFNQQKDDIRWDTKGLYTGSAADYANRVPVLDKDGKVTGYRIDNGPSLLKIGTGEGSQVYGHGLYASERRRVAELYSRLGLENFFGKKEFYIDGKKIKPKSDAVAYALELLGRHGSMYGAVTALGDLYKYAGTDLYDKLKGAYDFLFDYRDRITNGKSSYLYEQTFFTNRAKGDESHLLSWYDLISEENLERIKNELSAEGIDKKFGGMYWLRYHGMSRYLESGDITGALLDNGSTGDAVYKTLSLIVGGPKAASEFLARADIDGIKYPIDSYNKAVKDGDKAGWNYVSFRDDNIRVDHKWVNGEMLWDTELTPEETAYAESADKTPTEKVMREVFGMTNEDIEMAMRAAKMEPPRHEKKSDAKTWEQAEVLLSRPEYMVKLSRAVYKVGRPITDYENLALNVFFRERQEKVNRLTELLNEIMAMPKEALADPETAQMLKETKSDLANARQLMYETGVAAHQAASEQGRALRSNRGLLDKHDLTFAGILGQIASDIGGMNRVTAEMDARIKEISQEFNKLDKDGREIATARLKAFSEKVITDIKNGGRMRRASEKMVGDESKRVYRNYLDALAQIEVHAAEAGDTLIGLVDQMYPSWGRWLKYLGEYHCFMNPEISEEDCIKAIVEDIQPFLSGIDENQVRDMLTGFGHNYRQSRYDSQRLMNDLRAQARMKRQLDYMNENNQLPPTTGMIRDELSQTARQLAREVQERKKEVDETTGGANRLKGALAAAKTRVRNRIEDLQRAIDSGEKIPGRERTVREDMELRQLKERKDSLQAIYDKMFKTSNGVTDEQRIRMVEKALAKELERTMVDYSRAINGDFSKRQKRPSVTSATAEELRREISETRSAILELKKANYEFGLTPEEVAARNAKKIAAREAAIIRMAERIERGDLRPMKKAQPPMSADLQKRYDEMGRQLKLAHQKLADMRLDAQNATVPKWRRHISEYAKFLTASQRALMATMDFSAVLRQAARISLGHPKIMFRSFKKSIRAMMSDAKLLEVNDEIMSDELVREAVEKYGLHMRDIDAQNDRDVEMFHGMERSRIKFFGKEMAITDIPFFGELMLKSERHYITYLNAVSAELYTALANDKTRFPDGPTPWQKKLICDMINMWNGSGAISKKRRNAILKSGFNEIFWAPGLAISRIQTSFGYDVWAPLASKGIANEHGGYDAPSSGERIAMAKLGFAEHLKSTLAMIALGAILKFLAADDDDWYQFGQADWFEKLLMLASPKVRNTTIDLTGGERSVYDLAHTLVTGRKRTSTGKIQKLGEGYKAPDAVSVVQRFMEGKWSPWLSEAFALYNGKDYTGQQYGLAQFLKNKIPLSTTDITEQVSMNGIGTSLLTAPLTLLGAGGSTYDRKPYENAINPFLDAKKEYDAIERDETLSEEEREDKLARIREDNPLMRDGVREDIASDLAEIRKNESIAKRMKKRGEEADAELNEQVEQDKRNVLEKIRKYR